MVEQGGVLMATIEQQRNRIIQVMYIAMILALIYLFFHYVFSYYSTFCHCFFNRSTLHADCTFFSKTYALNE